MKPGRPGAPRPHGRSTERGAALVEFAIVVPLLFGVLFGIVDFGAAYSQQLDVRHGAREGARLVAVSYTTAAATGVPQSDVIITEICRRMDDKDGTTVTLAMPGTSAVGQRASVKVSRPLTSLSGFYGPLLNGNTLTSTVETRLEMTGTWSNRSKACA